MGMKYAIRNEDKRYFVTFTVVQWVDVFIRDHYKEILVDSIRYCQQNKGLEVYAWCMMTSHVHLIIGSSGAKPLSSIIRDLKSFTSRNIREAITWNKQESRKRWMMWLMERSGRLNPRNDDFQFWIQDNHPVELSTNKMMDQRLAYIHNNPVEAGFVDTPEHWLWSSAGDYANVRKGKIDLIFIE